MKSEAEIRDRLASLQSGIEEVWADTKRCGWRDGSSYGFDKLIEERSLLRWVLDETPPACDPKYQDLIASKWEYEP